MPYLNVNDTRLNVMQLSQTGSGPVRDLVMCHGLASSMGFWPAELLATLRVHFRVTLFDQRGHGRSRVTPSGYTAKDLGQDLAALLEALDIKNAHLMAHSFGGVAALSLLSAAPGNIASLVLLDTQIGLGRSKAAGLEAGMDASLIAALATSGVRVDPKDPFAGVHLITHLAQRALSGDPVVSDDFRVQFLVQSVPLSKAKRWMSLVNDTQAIAEMTQPDGLTAADLAVITQPVFGLYGAHSAAVHTGRLIAETAPHCQFEIMPNAGHFFVTSRAQEVADQTFAFHGISSDPIDKVAV